MIITIIDLGINNLTSVLKSFSSMIKPTDTLFITSGEGRVERPDLIVLPGLGKFSAGMIELENRGLIPVIQKWVNHGSKLVGICLGMQLLGNSSEESPGIKGLGLISGSSMKMTRELGEKVPNVGWREISGVHAQEIFKSLDSNLDFYFVHSYHFIPLNPEHTLAISDFGNSSFVSAIKKDNVCGFQFHPEKSGNSGQTLVSEILNWAKIEN